MQDKPPPDQSAQDKHGVGGAPAVEDWCAFLVAQEAIGWFAEPVTLSSGQRSSWYVNWRRIADDVYALDQATDMLLATARAKGLAPDVWYGVPEGATRLALLAQYKWAKAGDMQSYGPGSHRFSMGRAKPKTHGPERDRHFLGYPTGDVVVLEDVTTTGGSLVKTVQQLQAHGVQVQAAITMTDRSTVAPKTPSPADQLKALGVEFYAMTDARTLLPAALLAHPPQDGIIARLRQEIPDLDLLIMDEPK